MDDKNLLKIVAAAPRILPTISHRNQSASSSPSETKGPYQLHLLF
jgi:hypothetical protein